MHRYLRSWDRESACVAAAATTAHGQDQRGRKQREGPVTGRPGPTCAFTGVVPRHRRAEMNCLKLQDSSGNTLGSAAEALCQPSGPAGTTEQDLVTGEDGGVRLSVR